MGLRSPCACELTPRLEKSSRNGTEWSCPPLYHFALITGFFADRELVGPCLVAVAARRTLHLRLNDLLETAPIPRDTAYSSVFESNVPIIVQHTLPDSRQAEMSLLSIMAYAHA